MTDQLQASDTCGQTSPTVAGEVTPSGALLVHVLCDISYNDPIRVALNGEEVPDLGQEPLSAENLQAVLDQAEVALGPDLASLLYSSTAGSNDLTVYGAGDECQPSYLRRGPTVNLGCGGTAKYSTFVDINDVTGEAIRGSIDEALDREGMGLRDMEMFVVAVMDGELSLQYKAVNPALDLGEGTLRLGS